MCRVPAIGSLRSFGWCWVDTSVLLVACSLAPWPAPRLSSFIFLWMTLPNIPCRVFLADDVYVANDMHGLLFGLAVAALLGGAGAGAWRWGCEGRSSAQGAYPVFQAAPAAQRSTHGHGDGLEAWRTHADTRHPRDGTGRGYQPLSEVRLALWMKADMLVPGETVKVYGGPGGESPLLISSAQRGRAFLGTMKSRSTVQPGPVDRLTRR